MCALLYPAQVFVQCHWPWHHHLTLHSSHNWREEQHAQQEMSGWKMHPGTAPQRQNIRTLLQLCHPSQTLLQSASSVQEMLREPPSPPNRLFSTSRYVCFVLFLQVLRSFSTVQNKPVWHVKRKLQFIPVNRYVFQPSSLNPTPLKRVLTDLKWVSCLFRRNDPSGLL